MPVISLDVWLYGPIAKYAGDHNRGSHAHLSVRLPAGSTMRDLLAKLGIPLAEKGITFVNGELTDTPGLAADLDRTLQDGDRIGLFHELSMWPMHYRLGAPTGLQLKEVMRKRADGGLYHSSKR